MSIIDKRIKIVSIDGNIGSGKSTLVSKMKQYHTSSTFVIDFVLEPTSEWDEVVDSSGRTMLNLFYQNQDKYAFPFQMMAFITRYKVLKDSLDKAKQYLIEHPDTVRYIIITERSLYTDKYIFAKMLFDDKKIEQVNYTIYNKWFDVFAQDIPIHKQVYVYTPWSECKSRIDERNRDGESCISNGYLERCEEYHKDMMGEMSISQDVFKLDGLENIHTHEVFIKWYADLMNYVNM